MISKWASIIKWHQEVLKNNNQPILPRNPLDTTIFILLGIAYSKEVLNKFKVILISVISKKVDYFNKKI